ncbi:MAG: plasmid pRiA4b ORF-3 family protein [Microlunatus sp.]|nr:plasmid pRiA4b ORF-3 family protein [Microlunatus sp.]
MTPEDLRRFIGAVTAQPTDGVVADMAAAAVPAVGVAPDRVRGFRVRVDLVGAEPPVWRRLELPGDVTLPRLHVVIQAAMGWSDSHLHRFLTGAGFRAPYFVTRFDLEEGEDGVLEDDVRLDQVVAGVGDKLWYDYDFGDDWRHVLMVEAVLDPAPEQPMCIDGRRACPPEDCGGIGGYAVLAEWVRDGCPPDAVPEPFETLEHALGWLPPDWHPDTFSVAEANSVLASEMAEPIAVTGELAGLINQFELRGVQTLRRALRLPVWKQHADPSDDDIARMLDPYLVLLDLASHEVKLTRAGYLPPTLVEEAAERTGVTTWWIGKANREDLTYPVRQLRATAQALGLLNVRKGVLSQTAVVRRASGPRKIWEHIVARLPLARDDFNRQAGWTALAIVGSGVPAERWNPEISDLLSALGWRMTAEAGYRPPLADSPTLDVLEILAGRLRDRSLIGNLPSAAATARSVILAHAK